MLSIVFGVVRLLTGGELKTKQLTSKVYTSCGCPKSSCGGFDSFVKHPVTTFHQIIVCGVSELRGFSFTVCAYMCVTVISQKCNVPFWTGPEKFSIVMSSWRLYYEGL